MVVGFEKYSICFNSFSMKIDLSKYIILNLLPALGNAPKENGWCGSCLPEQLATYPAGHPQAKSIWKPAEKGENGYHMNVGCCKNPKCKSVAKYPNINHVIMGVAWRED